ncbi:methylmalonyl-CoA mutase small subunit [Rhodococcus triatomae]|uniref:Methylmalonyl-CoA mutase small subunit n=1 Tax=Rhodococcus triatomae TaxID=300028 RepID=A0A1G8K7U2_9NOCA|nr:methylmalonyl-CoA mutase small subunit [Rhodococcus triatomae]QNG18845.1 methylmalonyl-CoA mutase small subunit [Rhodococcus triatomae]QNG25242.1 methylmalonyl-CoA mutase small subunit [Rhodococcus triatomae]SDI39492.1 methylmalonyl-CoA mutase [Rhodococcus triatomae]
MPSVPRAEGPRAGDTAEAYQAWQKSVAGVLAKSRRVDPEELGPQPQKLLETVTYDGVTVAPLYTSRDERPEPPLPGTYPYVRGTDPDRDVNTGWKVTARYVGTDATTVNTEILDGLGAGVSALWLAVGGAGVPVGDLARALDGVLFDLAPLTLDAGAHTAAAAEALYPVLDVASVSDRAAVTVNLGAAPLTSAYADRPDVNLDTAVELAAAASARTETVRAITVDGTAFHDAGASDAEELGAAVAAGLEYLRAATGYGLTAAQALEQISFRFSATDDQFQTIGKFRAARLLWARVAQVCGASEFGGAPQHAVTSAAMMAQRDPWVNMLRTTLAAFGAGIGGADEVTVLPFDSALPEGALGVSRSFSARIARNTQLLLLEESNLGRVLDPAAGSWYVEDLTHAIAEAAWEFFQQIEAAGGFVQGGAVVRERIARTRQRRESDIAHRKTAVTGVNEFPNLAEAPLPAGGHATAVSRYAAQFEALRDRSDAHLAARGDRPRALLVPLGSVAEHNVRTTFASNLLASGGIEAVNPGPLALGDGAIAGAAAEAQATVAVICGTDKRYGTEASAAVDELRAAGVGTVLLAGSEKALADGGSRPDGYLTARIDAVSELTRLLDLIEADLIDGTTKAGAQ